MNSFPAVTERTGWCRITLGRPGIAAVRSCSTLGFCAPTAAIEQPSQLMPASQKAWTSVIGPLSKVNRGRYRGAPSTAAGLGASAIAALLPNRTATSLHLPPRARSTTGQWPLFWVLSVEPKVWPACSRRFASVQRRCSRGRCWGALTGARGIAHRDLHTGPAEPRSATRTTEFAGREHRAVSDVAAVHQQRAGY